MNDKFSCIAPILWTCFQVSYDYIYFFLNGGQHWILSILRRDILWKNKNSKFIFLKLDKHTHTHTHTHKIWFDICKTQYIKADPFSLLQNKDPQPIQTLKSFILILLLKLTWHSNTKNLQLKAGFSDEQNLNPR